jgi:3-oxoadipate enol-lactonase
MDFVCPHNITLHYRRDRAEGATTLVFVNSLGTDMRSWDLLISHLGTNYDLLRYDKRGHGLSDTPAGDYSISDHANDLHALLSHLGIAQPILIGLSVGGMVAMEYTALHPDNIRALVLCDTASQIGTPDGWSARIEAVQRRGMSEMAGEIIARWFAPDFAQRQPSLYQGMYNMLSRMPEAGYIATCAALRDGDLRSFIPTLDTQTLVLVGDEDLATPPDQVREFAEALPNARFEVIKEAGHLVCIEQPGIMAAKISEFVQEIEHVR